jgi:two-component system, chemotaxis family, chemotaxis protein CheY
MPSANILIVDDSQAVRAVIRSLIQESNGLRVCGEAADGVEAIEKTRELKPDLILLDLAMPKLNGAATASVLRRLMPKVPIILFTMYADAADKLAQALGVDMVISKPDGVQSLVQKVHSLLDSRSMQDNRTAHSAPRLE